MQRRHFFVRLLRTPAALDALSVAAAHSHATAIQFRHYTHRTAAPPAASTTAAPPFGRNCTSATCCSCAAKPALRMMNAPSKYSGATTSSAICFASTTLPPRRCATAHTTCTPRSYALTIGMKNGSRYGCSRGWLPHGGIHNASASPFHRLAPPLTAFCPVLGDTSLAWNVVAPHASGQSQECFNEATPSLSK